ncbi:MAG: FliH/SctL family protein [Planctomycetota bacterium]|jgi:flagellar biosynthesis/type III secretory pathway protein FliH
MKKVNLRLWKNNTMSDPLAINLSGPITSVKILDNYPASIGGKQTGSQAGTGQIPTQDLGTQKAVFSQVCQALNAVVIKLNQFYDKVFAEHREEITRLSVEIARKILMQKVEKGDYEIESIVKEALKNAPSRQDVVVHLNPEDLAQCQKAQQDEPSGTFVGIKFASDPNIGRAECLLESPKGIIESLIDQHLERIGQALNKAE